MTRKKPEPKRSNPYPGTYKEPSGTWRYVFDAPCHPDGSRNQKQKGSFPTQKAASDAREAARVAMRANGYIAPTNETLEQYFARFMTSTKHGRRASTNNNYTRAFAFFPETFRKTKLEKVTPNHVRMAYAQIVEVYAPKTCVFARAVLVMTLKAAHEDRLIPFNPAHGIKLPISRDAEADAAFDPKNVWSVEETNQFLNATLDHPDHALWRLLLDSGLRIGEALALTWDDIDLETRRVRVLRTITEDEDGREILGTQPKTASSRRELGIQSDTIAHLIAHRTRQKVRRMELGPLLWVQHNLVFDAGDGSLMAKQRARTRFATAVGQVGVKPLTLHGCRHTMAVTWLQMGRSPASVAARLGHKSAAFTLDVYAKVSAQWQMNDVDIVETMRKTPQKEERTPEIGTLIAWPE